MVPNSIVEEKSEDKVHQDGIVVQGTESYEKGATNSERIVEAAEKCERGGGCQNWGVKRLLGETKKVLG